MEQVVHRAPHFWFFGRWDEERADCAIDHMPLSKQGTITLQAFLFGWARLCVEDLRGHHIFIAAEATDPDAMAEITMRSYGILAHGDKEAILAALLSPHWERDAEALFREHVERLVAQKPRERKRAMFLWHPDKVWQLLCERYTNPNPNWYPGKNQQLLCF